MYDVKIFIKYKLFMLKDWFKSIPDKSKRAEKRIRSDVLSYLGYAFLLLTGYSVSMYDITFSSMGIVMALFCFLASDYLTGQHRAWNRASIKQKSILIYQNEEVKNDNTDNSSNTEQESGRESSPNQHS